MDNDTDIKKLEARIEYLENKRRFIQNSLDMALSLGDFHEEIGNEYTPEQMFEETAKRIKQLIQFEACAFFLVDQKSSDLHLSYCKPGNCKSLIEDAINFYIEKGFVAWAIREKRGVSFLSKDRKRQVMLHVIATRSKIRGLFIGVFPPGKDDIPDGSLELLSIILRNTANALGSIEYNEHILAEKELRGSKERIERILFSLPAGIVIVDAETHLIIDANQNAASIIEAPVEEIIGAACRKYLCSAKDSCPISDMGLKVDNSERILTKTNSKKIPIQKSVIPAVLDGKKCFIESFVDISEHKKSEQERIQKEKLRGVIEMAGAVCHELNQPLQVVYGYSDILLMNMEKDHPEYESIIKIKEQTERIREITKKLMGITKYETKEYLKGRIIDIDRASEKQQIKKGYREIE